MSKVDIQTVLFPVEARPVFVLLNDTKTPDLFDAKSGTSPIKRAPNHLAIVDLEREHTLAVVSKNYRLVLNSEAIETQQNTKAERQNQREMSKLGNHLLLHK